MASPPRPPKVLFVCLQTVSFVRDDLASLSERYDVRLFEFASHRYTTKLSRAWGLARLFASQTAWLAREGRGADGIYVWFVDYHAVLPVLWGKLTGTPVAVPVAGFDAIVLPHLRYGVYFSRWRRGLARFVVRNVSRLLPVSETMIREQNAYSAYPETLKNGIAHHVPRFDTPYVVIPFGYTLEDWPMGPEERGATVLTVGLVDSDRTLRRKGLDLYFEAARRLPDVRFEVIGVTESFLPDVRDAYAPPENVIFLPKRPREDLIASYQQAAVYAQVSRAEGMPNVLCEAMACGCVPVGSAVFGIPEVIGDAGIVVEEADPDGIAAAFRRALVAGPDAHRRARARIAQHFTTAHRREALYRELDTLMATDRR